MSMRSADYIGNQTGGYQIAGKWEQELLISGFDDNSFHLSMNGGFNPKKSPQRIDVHMGAQSRWFRGKNGPIESGTVTVNDYVDIDTASKLEAWEDEHEDPNTGNIKAAANYKRTSTVIRHAPEGTGLADREWQLFGCGIDGGLDAGEWTFEDNAQVQISFSMAYDSYKRSV